MNTIPVKITEDGLKCNHVTYARFLEKNNGKWADVIVREPKRSLSQNSYYWLYLHVIARETGNDEDELHEFFKQKFLPFKTVRIQGKETVHEFKRSVSTTELNKLDFGDYLDKICAMVKIPLPDPQAAGYLPH